MKTNCDYYYIVIFKMKLCVIHNTFILAYFEFWYLELGHRAIFDGLVLFGRPGNPDYE